MEREKSEKDDLDDSAGEGEGEGDRRPNDIEDRRGADELGSSPLDGDSEGPDDDGESFEDLNRGINPENPEEVLILAGEEGRKRRGGGS